MPRPRRPTTHPHPKEHSSNHSVDLEHPRDTLYADTGKKSKKRHDSNIFRRLGIVKKRQSRPAETGPDYTQRWPTVTTLLEHRSDSWFFEEEDEEEPAKPAKAKALRAIAAPLGWLNVRLESMQEHLDYKILLFEARAQKRASQSSSRRDSEQPGQSTHPYDTGIQETIDEEEEETSRRNSKGPPATSRVDAFSSVASAQDTTPATDNKLTRQPWRKIRFGSQSERQSPMQPHTSADPRGHEQRPATTTNCNSAFGRDSTVSSEQTQMCTGPTVTTRKVWRNPFSTNAMRAERTQTIALPHAAPNQQIDEEDVASIPKPRRKWKRTKDRRGSAYPHKKVPVRKSQEENERSVTSQQKATSAAVPHESLSPKEVVKKTSKPKISRGSTPQPSKGKSSPLRPALSHQSSKQPVCSATSGTQRRRSSANRAADTGTNSSKACTPALRDSATISPRAGAFRHLLGLAKESPPSRAISPFEIDENEAPDIRTVAPLKPHRLSTDATTTSGHRASHGAPAPAPSTEINTADVVASHGEKKEGGWLGMVLRFGGYSKEHTLAEPIAQSSGPGAAQSALDGKTSSRRPSAMGN